MPSHIKPSADKIITDLMSNRARELEAQIMLKSEALDIFHKLLHENPDDQFIMQQHDMIMVDLKTLTKELLSIRKDADVMNPERFDGVPSLEDWVKQLKERL